MWLSFTFVEYWAQIIAENDDGNLYVTLVHPPIRALEIELRGWFPGHCYSTVPEIFYKSMQAVMINCDRVQFALPCIIIMSAYLIFYTMSYILSIASDEYIYTNSSQTLLITTGNCYFKVLSFTVLSYYCSHPWSWCHPELTNQNILWHLTNLIVVSY